MELGTTSFNLPQAFSAVSNLGPIESVYRAAAPSMKQKFISWLIATCIVGVILAVGHFGEGMFRRNGMEMVGVAAKMLGSFGLIVVGGVWLLLLIAMSLFNLVLFSKPQVVAIYRDGIANFDKGKLQAWAWTDIREVYAYYFADTATSDAGFGTRFDLVHKDGSTFLINHFVVGCQELMTRVRREVYTQVYPEINRSFEAGQPVLFGKDLIVEQEGLRIAKTLLPWVSLSGYAIQRGLLVLRTEKSQAQVPVASIPNLELALDLLSRKLPQPA